MKTCDVCGEREAVRVACSVTGAISFAYCQECLQSHREPYGAVVASLVGVTNMDEVAEWYRPVIEVMLKAEGKTEEELFADVAVLEREYIAAMRKQPEEVNDATTNRP